MATILMPPLSLIFVLSLHSAHAFFTTTCSNLALARIDPIVSPGKVSGHAHIIVGGSNININSTYNSLIHSNFTSCQITADKSAYWTPQLYYQREDVSKTIVKVPSKGTTIYYLGRGNNETFEAFPPGLSTLSGTMTARSYDNTNLTYSNGRHIADGVSFKCITPVNKQTNGLLGSLPCTGDLRAPINFQSCWDGVHLNSTDESHVAYMSQIDNGDCPPTHPHHFSHLFFEAGYDLSKINQADRGRLVLAQGDPTGYGFHGDFFNGWNTTVLSATLAPGSNDCISSDTDNTISNVNYCNALTGETLLHVAARQGHLDVIQCLLQHHAIIDSKEAENELTSFGSAIQCAKRLRTRRSRGASYTKPF